MPTNINVPAGPTADNPLQGLACLSPTSRRAVSALGHCLAAVPADARALPRTYELVAAAQALPDGVADEYAYEGILPHIERMARNGMSAPQIADRFGLDRQAFQECVVFVPQIRQALKGGLARGIDAAASVISDNAEKGETQAASFLLKTKGGFQAPVTTQPAVQVNIGSQTANVDLADIQAMKARQGAIMKEYTDAEWEEI